MCASHLVHVRKEVKDNGHPKERTLLSEAQSVCRGHPCRRCIQSDGHAVRHGDRTDGRLGPTVLKRNCFVPLGRVAVI
ncbi:MAG: hypothetical protein RLZZ613_1532, partial [Pseudomonadota bacterium]